MFTVCLNASLRSNKLGARPCILLSTNIRRTFCCLVQLKTHNNGRIICTYDRNGYRYLNHNFTNSNYVRKLLNVELSSNCQIVRNYASENVIKKEDVFGVLGDRKFEKIEMDEDEKKEEEFVENEARIPRRLKPSPGGYANLIKSHIQNKNLTAAMEVLDLIKLNRDKPNVYMYNLLLRAFAVAGDFKKCRSLYALMKKRGLACNGATYTSILNVCANYPHKEVALDYLEGLRQEFAKKNIVLNETHYNTMIKAYGRHGAILEAFSLADEMRDKRLSTNEITFNSLLIGTISNREAGLRHALVIWHLLRRHGIKPSITTYNLFLRAIRDTKLGELRINDFLIEAPPHTQIYLNNEKKPDLLAQPPVVNSLLFTEIALKEDAETIQPKKAILEIETSKKKKDVSKSETDTNLPSEIDSICNEKSLIDQQSIIKNTPLEAIRMKNRLILFGGVAGILQHMEKDGVIPDTKSMTLLMELTPASNECERSILQVAKAKKIPLDIDFFNMLMKKRSLRRDYKGAKEILDDIQRNGLFPDIITWGILALGCHTLADAQQLMDGMEVTGHRLNEIIAGTLINNACRKMRFAYVLGIMNSMSHLRIQPNYELYCTLDAFEKEVKEMMRSRKSTRTTNHPAFKAGAVNFQLAYKKWRAEMKQRDEIKKQEKREKIAEKKAKRN
ncbi:pentatricopeptide repeat-containing protein 1, mitochondrial [Venturia canescens]|uniref:pentatricopeptide repeat-containing protein 1, mitochondrial n=1 Tax=Venturia canescens TaxID=32260 RepID=UPI001C9CA44F|nr:pentatricopeptide repeat-containing protein 1, mitochondrial [Venturia canescens]XP_043285643.1 pentatricopeptide repeat-containing protein 1, mitochondrial [Venturia canescens]